MKKKHVIIASISIALISFACGYYTFDLLPKQESNINIFGTYVHDFSTLSINHNSTYQYTYPFTSGETIKIDEQVYKLENGDLKGYIVIFSKDSVKLVNTKNNTSEEFTKNTSSESQLDENN